MLVFEKREKSNYRPEETSRSKDEDQQQTQPTYGSESENSTRATMVGGECSHHRAISAPKMKATEQFFLLDEILKCDHSNESYYNSTFL